MPLPGPGMGRLGVGGLACTRRYHKCGGELKAKPQKFKSSPPGRWILPHSHRYHFRKTRHHATPTATMTTDKGEGKGKEKGCKEEEQGQEK